MRPPRHARTRICGIILAAGASTRMRQPKQLMTIGGKMLLQHVVDAAAASRLASIIIVLGHEADAIERALVLPRRARTVTNASYADGLASSLVYGLRAAIPGNPAAAILLGDEPAIRADAIDAVIEAFRASQAFIARALYAGDAGARTPGHPVIIDRELWPLTEDLRGDEGLRRIIRAHPEWTLDVEIDRPAPADIDTMTAYRAAGGDALP